MKNKTFLRFVILSVMVNVFFVVTMILYFIFYKTQPYTALFISAFMICYHFDIRILIALILQPIKKNIILDSKIYLIKEKEYHRLERLSINKWKDHFVTMFKDQFKLTGKSRKEQMDLLLRNNIHAERVHWLCFLFGLLGILFGCLISMDEWYIYLITSILPSFLVDFPPILIQRYNRYRILKLRNHQKGRHPA